MNLSRRITRTATSLFLAAVALVWLSTSGTLGGFAKASLKNPSNSTRVASLSVTNSIGGSGCTATASGATVPNPCTDSLYPASATTAGAAGPANTITNSGTVPASAMTSRYKVAGCGPVYAANSVGNGANGSLLPRYSATFTPNSGPIGNSGSLAFTGTSGAYAVSTGATTEPATTRTADTYGLGIWFKTTSAATSPLFTLSASPLADASAASDRTLYLDANGRIAFVPETGRTTVPGPANGAGFNDGEWHFAYVSLSWSNGFLGLNAHYVVRIYVDGDLVTTANGASNNPMDKTTGYWHLGWAPAPTAGYFTGSLAGFVVDDSGDAPTSSTARPTTYAFDANRTQEWDLTDSGGSYDGTSVGGVYTGAYPANVPNPCSAVTLTWTTSNPSATVFSGVALSTSPTSGSVVDPEPGAAQSSTISLSHASNINPYLLGLIIYAPVVSTYSTGSWQVSFMWNAPTAGSTFVIR